MLYKYLCPNCNKEHLVNKPMALSGDIEWCQCGEVLKRVYEAASIKTLDGFKK